MFKYYLEAEKIKNLTKKRLEKIATVDIPNAFKTQAEVEEAIKQMIKDIELDKKGINNIKFANTYASRMVREGLSHGSAITFALWNIMDERVPERLTLNDKKFLKWAMPLIDDLIVEFKNTKERLKGLYEVINKSDATLKQYPKRDVDQAISSCDYEIRLLKKYKEQLNKPIIKRYIRTEKK